MKNMKSTNDEFELVISESEKSDTIYRNSPYYKRYNNLMAIQQMEIDQENEDKMDIDRNRYYAPELMDKVMVKWMPFAVLWSSLDLDVFAPEISRVSNAYIESNNKVLKRHTFQGTS